jgi:hypothetical protein
MWKNVSISFIQLVFGESIFGLSCIDGASVQIVQIIFALMS